MEIGVCVHSSKLSHLNLISECVYLSKNIPEEGVAIWWRMVERVAREGKVEPAGNVSSFPLDEAKAQGIKTNP